MTGYTVHTGTSEKFAAGWDQIFSGGGTKPAKKAAKQVEGAKATKKAAPAKKAAKKAKRGK